MQDKSNIDIKIREKLNKSTAPMPDGLFASIMDGMPENQTKKKAWFGLPYLFLGLGIVLLLTLLKTCTGTETNKLSTTEEQMVLNQNLAVNQSTQALQFNQNIKKINNLNPVEEKEEQTRYSLELNEANLKMLNSQFTPTLSSYDLGFYSTGLDVNQDFKVKPSLEDVKNGEILEVLPLKTISIETPVFNPTKEKRTEKSKFALRLFGGPSVNYRTLSVKTYTDLEQHRNAHEKAYTSFSFGGHLSYALSNKLELFSGLEYVEVGEKYAFKHNEIEHNTENTYSYLSIPVGVGYKISKQNKYYSMVRAQLNTNINNASQASWIDPNTLTAVAHSDKGEHNPYREVTFSGRIAMEIGVAFEKIDLFVSPTANYTFSNIYKTQEAINQHPFSAGANFGLRLKF